MTRQDYVEECLRRGKDERGKDKPMFARSFPANVTPTELALAMAKYPDLRPVHGPRTDDGVPTM